MNPIQRSYFLVHIVYSSQIHWTKGFQYTNFDIITGILWLLGIQLATTGPTLMNKLLKFLELSLFSKTFYIIFARKVIVMAPYAIVNMW